MRGSNRKMPQSIFYCIDCRAVNIGRKHRLINLHPFRSLSAELFQQFFVSG
jgi:hypothetical protein